MNEEYIDTVKHLIEQKDADKVKELLIDLHPADIAELCNDLNAEGARFIYRLLDNETAADVLVEMDEDARKELLEMLPSETIAKRFVDYMDTDDAVDLMRELDEDKQEEVLSHIEDIEQAGDIVDLLKYDENTAGGLMGTEMVLVNENWSMPECLKEMRQQAEELDEIYYVYVIDDDERLRGIFPLKKMITSPSVSKVKHVMQKDPISVHVDTPIDEVVQAIEKYDLVAIPVIDSIGRLVGQITVDDVMDEVREQSERDYQLASGLSQDVETDDNVLKQTTARLPWLLIGMLGGIGNSMILGNFDSTFAAHPEMALYIPLIGGNRGSSQTASDSADTSTDLSQAASEMQQRTDALIASADKLMAGLTDVAGSANATETDLNKGAEGSLPEQTVTVDQIANANPTPAPADSTADGSESTENGDTTPDTPDNSGDNNTNNGGTSAEGETINVTMNGTAQTMDLVRCLAMVAQNELGSSAPAEAYKAQCVATHCWILSQSGYPSVLGAEPGAAALAAAQEVAHVLVTYNGQVCFTPYFASASTGTASAAEVWGNDRAWLQAVDSPYDQQIATNWNTNGNSSGTARFSRQTLQDRIKDVMDIDLSGVDPNSWFTIQSANQYGWVAKIQVGPDAGVGTVSGRWFRENLLARQSVDGRSLRSQCFTVSYNADLDCFIFDVYGYGHGCGMSQWGAIGYARNGWGYQDILTHYFVGTTITTY